jgi:hypothetical protein
VNRPRDSRVTISICGWLPSRACAVAGSPSGKKWMGRRLAQIGAPTSSKMSRSHTSTPIDADDNFDLDDQAKDDEFSKKKSDNYILDNGQPRNILPRKEVGYV